MNFFDSIVLLELSGTHGIIDTVPRIEREWHYRMMVFNGPPSIQGHLAPAPESGLFSPV
jgi:hypothetical protein